MTKSPGLTSGQTSGRNFFLASLEKTRIARVDPCAAGQFTQKTPGLTSTCQIPCLTPGSTAATSIEQHRAPRDGPFACSPGARGRGHPRDVPEGRIQFKLPVFFT